MSAGKIASKPRQIYKFIDAHRNELSIQMMCRLLGVARAGYYAWREHPVSYRAREDARLLRLIHASVITSHGIYGAARVFFDLRERRETCSKQRVARLMQENGLRALHGYRIRHIPTSKPHVLIPNLLQRQFTVSRPNEAWVTDITYIRTWEGWLYMAAVLDIFSRRIVDWAVRPTIHRELFLDAVMKPVRSRRPRKVLIHSDQGSQSRGDSWRRFCKDSLLEPSKSWRANCWDNAVAESFFSSLKKERIKKRIYASREVATSDLSEYIEGLYNLTRSHSHLGGFSPDEFEAAHRHPRSGVH